MAEMATPERLLLALVDTLQRQLVVVDREHRVILVNRSFERATGRKAEDVVGKLWNEVFPDGDPGPMERAFSGAGPQLIVEEMPGGACSSWVERGAVPVLDGKGTIAHVLESRRDVTAEHQLSLSHTENRSFCHEINNALFAAMGTAELMAEDVPEGQMAHELEVILRNLRRISELTRKMRERIIASQQQARAAQEQVLP